MGLVEIVKDQIVAYGVFNQRKQLVGGIIKHSWPPTEAKRAEYEIEAARKRGYKVQAYSWRHFKTLWFDGKAAISTQEVMEL